MFGHFELPNFYMNAMITMPDHGGLKEEKFKHPDSLKNILTDQEFKLYNMIWKRTVASQMKSAKLEQTIIKISAEKYLFETKGKVIVFPGFLKSYVESVDNKDTKLDNAE